MNRPKFGLYAASLMSVMMGLEAKAADDMDIHKVKGKDGKEYFCANATCAGNSSCMGAGNDKCGGKNKCASTSQGYLTGWFYADDKESCEKGVGKWVLYKKEYEHKNGNKLPFGKNGKPETVKKKS